MSKLNSHSNGYRRLAKVALCATALITLAWLGSEALRQSPPEDLRAAQSAPTTAPGAVEPREQAHATVVAKTSQVEPASPEPSENTKRPVTKKAKAARRTPVLPPLPAPTARDGRLPDMEVSALNGPAMLVPRQ